MLKKIENAWFTHSRGSKMLRAVMAAYLLYRG